ncbi:ATP-dependent helicase [Corynebacterium sp. zg-331]|uniref:ATP-dependent DNA helicase n=1 Tax=unclassified Corynebacterium TaxID=2624378 RepID=UPI00128C7994|nr:MULTISPECIES: ATP-dependent DNA helicase [unclassified Corynebacterium]MBC3185879.1 ATP-dependent helicase [Corynebacterium sp. zg-331]MPV52370.1 AAA family ATPase [Corynebacterium sp. zg331]
MVHTHEPAPTPEVVLTRRNTASTQRRWDELATGLPQRGRWRITGPAGSGVSSLLVDTAVAAIEREQGSSGVLLITAAKDSAARLRREIHDRLLASGQRYATEEPVARSLHSLAFALLRRVSKEKIRLITGAEQDAVIRELLAGHAEEGRGPWPPEHVPALEMVGFARQLRDFLLRAAERGVGAERLEELGRAHGRPAWAAAGGFLREYERTMALSGAHSYSASELVHVALGALRRDPSVLDGLWHTVLVDDAQHLDPLSGELVEMIARRATLAVVGGDPEQSIFHFRGASPDFLRGFPAEREVALARSRRTPRAGAYIADSALAEQARYTDVIRRAHLLDGVAWSQIAVIVRSAGMIDPVRRVLLSTGVPVHIEATDTVLAQQPLVAGIVLGVRALSEQLRAHEWEALLLGPVGGADPVTLRRLLRGLRRSDMSTRAMVTLGRLLDPARVPDEEQEARLREILTQREWDILTRMRAVLDAGNRAKAAGGSVEEVLWELWDATGLAERLSVAALRGGAAGSQADRDLDAMMALFDAAGDYVERRPHASVDSFIRHIEEQELPTGVRDRRSAPPEAVTVLTAHGAAGRQWHTVVVAGVQDDAWPALGETGTLFEQEEFIDLVDSGIDPDLIIGRTQEKIAEERRLFHVATTRATGRLLVTAVAEEADEVREPSRFLEQWEQELGVETENPGPDGQAAESVAAGAERQTDRPRFAVLSAPAAVAELRRVLCAADTAEATRIQAARQLARLARAGVPGAHPDQWWGARGPSTREPLVAQSHVSVSPSNIEKLHRCPLRAVAEKFLSSEESSQMLKGTLVHAYAEALERGVAEETARDIVTRAWREHHEVPRWRREQDAAEWARVLDRTRDWIGARGPAVGVEMKITVPIGEEVTIAGRLDRLDRDDAGDHYVVDFKTGARSGAVQENMQLRAYQLALARGEIRGDTVVAGKEHPRLGGAMLVYPASDRKKIPVLAQAALSPEEQEELAALLPTLAAELRGPSLLARVNDGCRTCVLKTVCPVQPEGKSTIERS